MERNSFKEYSVLAMVSKEEQRPMKACYNFFSPRSRHCLTQGVNISKNFVMNYIYREIMKICNKTSLYIFQNTLISNITDPNFAVN